MLERELERLHADLLRLAPLPADELRALVESLLGGEELASSEQQLSRVKKEPAQGGTPRRLGTPAQERFPRDS